MGNPRHLAVAAAVAVLAPGVASAAPAPAPQTNAPRVSGVQMPAVVTARQGHARFLVGVRTATRARVIARIVAAGNGKVLRTTKTPALHAKGRVWLLVEANNSRGFQLPRGRYRVEVYAVDAAKRRSNTILRTLTLTLKPARGVIHAYTVPAWPSIVSGVAAAAGGQIVAAVAPGSALSTAGVRRGDVIHSVNGRSVQNRGAWFAALRGLPANAAATIEIDRGGVRQTVSHVPPPDWTAAPNYTPVLAASVGAAPDVLAYRYAAARERLDAKATAAAKALYAKWTTPQRGSAPGEFLSGAISAAEAAPVATPAGAYNRALAADPTMAAVQFAMGVLRTGSNQNDRALTAFQSAMALDPTDAVAATFYAFALLRADRFSEALTTADIALARDVRYEEARIARGLALIGLERTAEGVADLKRGLTLMDNAARAQQIITSSLEPNTP